MEPNDTAPTNPPTPPQPQPNPSAAPQTSGFNAQPPSFTPPPAQPATPYTSPASTGQFGSYPPTNNLPPDSFGSATSPYIPSTPVGVSPQPTMNSSFPASPQAPAQEVSTTTVDSSKSKKLWMILIPVIILLLGGGGSAAYFMLSGNSSPKEISPDYTITPNELPETASPQDSAVQDSASPVESGFNNTENTQLPPVDTALPAEGQAPADSTQILPADQTTTVPAQ